VRYEELQELTESLYQDALELWYDKATEQMKRGGHPGLNGEHMYDPAYAYLTSTIFMLQQIEKLWKNGE
jgi:hypothetical protein